MITTEDGVYTKTQAFNFLKGLLGVSKKVRINRKFFFCFFYEIEKNVFVPKISEKNIQDIFLKEGIVNLNANYWEKKKEGKLEEAKLIADHTLKLVVKNLNTAVA